MRIPGQGTGFNILHESLALGRFVLALEAMGSLHALKVGTHSVVLGDFDQARVGVNQSITLLRQGAHFPGDPLLSGPRRWYRATASGHPPR